MLITARHGSFDTGLGRLRPPPSVTHRRPARGDHSGAPVASADGTAMLVSVTLKNQTTKVGDLLRATAAVQRPIPRCASRRSATCR